MTSNGLALPARLRRWSAATLAAALMNPFAASSSDGPGHRLAGVVWISPICAGAQREGEVCRAPLAGVEVHLNEGGGRVAASATTDAAGAFTIHAPAGRYRLHVAGLVKLTRCPDLDITLPMTKSAPVDLECDTGMR